MSQGNNLTRRQRRGRSVTPVNLSQFPLFFLNDYDTGAGIIQMIFDQPMVVSEDPADWFDLKMITGDPSHVIAIWNEVNDAVSPPQYITNIQFDVPYVDSQVMSANMSRCPVRASNGAPCPPWSVMMYTMIPWPPLTLPYP